MTRHRRPWVVRIYAYLESKGGAAPRRQVIEEAAMAVAPGRAYRTGLAKAKTQQRYVGGFDDLRSDSSQLVRAGAHKTATAAIQHEIKMGRLIRYDHEGRVWLKTAENR